MTRVKICGLTRECDIDCANEILPEFAGFVFAEGSRRCIDADTAERLRYYLDYRIASVGVFVDAGLSFIADLARRNIIDLIQLHGHEDSAYIAHLRELTDIPLIQAFIINTPEDIKRAEYSEADLILLDSGRGTGESFDHSLIKNITRPYFLAGGLTPENTAEAVKQFSPYAVDASSSLETNGFKDPEKMRAFVNAARL